MTEPEGFEETAEGLSWDGGVAIRVDREFPVLAKLVTLVTKLSQCLPPCDVSAWSVMVFKSCSRAGSSGTVFKSCSRTSDRSASAA